MACPLVVGRSVRSVLKSSNIRTGSEAAKLLGRVFALESIFNTVHRPSYGLQRAELQLIRHFREALSQRSLNKPWASKDKSNRGSEDQGGTGPLSDVLHDSSGVR